MLREASGNAVGEKRVISKKSSSRHKNRSDATSRAERRRVNLRDKARAMRKPSTTVQQRHRQQAVATMGTCGKVQFVSVNSKFLAFLSGISVGGSICVGIHECSSRGRGSGEGTTQVGSRQPLRGVVDKSKRRVYDTDEVEVFNTRGETRW